MDAGLPITRRFLNVSGKKRGADHSLHRIPAHLLDLEELKHIPFELRTKTEKGKTFLYDNVRKKWLLLTPEELVRQHTVHWLFILHKVPKALISLEKEIRLNGVKKRYDIVVYSKNLQPLLLVECKAPEIKLTKDTIEQALRYNLILQVKYLIITNGIDNLFYQINEGRNLKLTSLPDYNDW